MKTILSYFIPILLMGIAVNADAQIILQPQLPSQGLVQQSQLWTMLVINNGAPVKNGVIEMVMQEENTGRRVFSGRATNVYLSTGANQLTISNIGGVQYDYSGGTISPSSGLLPIGQFQVCFQMAIIEDKGSSTQTCVPITVQPFAPPQLAFPANQSQVTTPYPVFSWLGPVPANMFTDLRYKIVLTEMQAGQTPADAMQRNPLLFLQDGLKDISLMYPSSYVALKQGRTYAWQVIAQNGASYSAATEIWQFTVKPDSISVLMDASAFPHLQRGVGTTHFIVQQKIKFSYDNEANDSLINVEMYQPNVKGNVLMGSKKMVVQRGINYVDLNINQFGKLQPGQDYVLEIVNGWKENWSVRFRYEPETNK